MTNYQVIPPAKNFRMGFKKLHPDAVLPTKAHATDLGMDLYALEDTVLTPGKVTKVKTGIAGEFPLGYGALIRDRSSVATKKEVFVVAGVIDQEYTGELIVAFFNPGEIRFETTRYYSGVTAAPTYSLELIGAKEFKQGDKIAQLILTPTVQFPIIEVDTLEETARNDRGFGSSGR